MPKLIAKGLVDFLQPLGRQWNFDPNSLQRIGKGDYADVYWLKDRRKVLKVTHDASDAMALASFFKNPNKNFVKVYNVARLETMRAYALLEEKLTPLSGRAYNKWDELFDYIYEQWGIRPQNFNGIEQRWIAALRQQLQEHDLYQEFEKEFIQCSIWSQILERRQIIYSDFHTGNIMQRGSQLVINDLGLSKSPMVQLQVIASKNS